MPTTKRKTCEACGATVIGDDPGGCPGCLFQLASDVAMADRSVAGAFTPPEVEDLASLMPDFEFLGTLGRGGMGVVYEVLQKRLNRVAALKALPPERASDPSFVERFFREAQALAQLEHPNIVRVYDMGQRGPFLYILMEYVDGVSLRECIRDKSVTPAEAMRIVADLCDAAQSAHEQGIVHRDIKPENVLIGEDGRIKLVDFGLVRLACNSDINRFTLTEINLRMGTPAYMSPEQTAGSPDIDHRVDIYALGVLLYETLTGEPPALDYTPPSRRVAVDPRIDRVVHRAVRESPSERYESAAEMRREIEHIARTPRRRLAVFGAIVAVLLVAVFAGYLWRRAAMADPAPPPGAPIDGTPIAVVPFSVDEARMHQQRWAERLGVPVRWTNSIGMEFVLIPPGEYTRGIPKDQIPLDFALQDPDIDPSRRAVLQSCIPAHRVRLTRAFYLCTTETTQEQYERIAGHGIGYFRAGMPGERVLDRLDTDNFPVENLSWGMAVQFCGSLSELDGFTEPDRGYRLPTDAEWGFAVRAGADSTFWYGAEPDVACVYEVSSNCTTQHPLPVGAKAPNPFGLYDMGGNVSEYCSDWWSVDEYRRYANRCALDPTGPKDGIPGGMQRVVRGGNFGLASYGHASMRRSRHDPTLWVNTIGFRVAISADVVAERLRDGHPLGVIEER